MGFNKKITQLSNQYFFVALEASEGWETYFGVVNKTTNETIFIIIDYNYLPIRCWFCFEPSHYIKECVSFIALKEKNMKTNKLGEGEDVYRDNLSIGSDIKTRSKKMTNNKKTKEFHDDLNREKVEGGDL